jgi:hypothetical protein
MDLIEFIDIPGFAIWVPVLGLAAGTTTTIFSRLGIVCGREGIARCRKVHIFSKLGAKRVRFQTELAGSGTAGPMPTARV